MTHQISQKITDSEKSCFRKIAALIQKLHTEETKNIPFIGPESHFDHGSEWCFSYEKTDLDLWKSARTIARKSTLDLRSLIGCSEWFAKRICESSDEDLAKLSIHSVSCFRCNLSDLDIYEMAEDAISDTYIVEDYRTRETEAFINCFWQTVFILISHDSLLCKSFFNFSENSFVKLLEVSKSPNAIYRFIRMKGHRFELSCNEGLFRHSVINQNVYSDSQNIGKTERSEIYHRNVYRDLIALKQSAGCLSQEKYAQINNIKPASKLKNSFDSTSRDDLIHEHLVNGYKEEEIAIIMNIAVGAVKFVKRKLEKYIAFQKHDDELEKTRPYQWINGIVCSNEYNQNRTIFLRGMSASMLSIMGISKAQTKIMFGISDAKAKRYRSKAKELGYIDKHVEPKTSLLEWRIIESIFVAIYVRIGGSKVSGKIDPFVAHESFCALRRGLVFDKEGTFKNLTVGFDNFVHLAMLYRQGHLSVAYCPICKCNYAKRRNAETGTAEGDCPLCNFRDVHVDRWLTAGVK